MLYCRLLIVLIFFFFEVNAQLQFSMYGDVKVTIDVPLSYSSKKTQVILFALPNGNTTAQTMGKKMEADDDWHYDIQQIKAQTAFIRKELKNENIIVAYLENNYLSWPTWKTKHPAYTSEVQHIADTILSLFKSKQKTLSLSGHSGGGRFIFSYLDGVDLIPAYVERISFLDSDYGYDNSYLQKLWLWLNGNSKAKLNVFAYNDSVALLNGKRFVSDTGGTWYRSHMMLADLSKHFNFKKIQDDSIIIYSSTDKRINFFFKTNPEKKIFHTVQVERNGFIHSILLGTKRESKKYKYFGERAYSELIE
jgi:hypothetical protein